MTSHRPTKLSKTILAEAVAQLQTMDADLDRSVKAMGVPPLWARPMGYATLVQIILEQQVSLASAHAVYSRMSRGLGKVTTHTVTNTTPEHLREFGLTRQKASYCHDLALSIQHGRLDLKHIGQAHDSEAHRLLSEIRGIGTWSASIYLLMGLRRPDIWPDGDVALAQSASVVKRLNQRPSYDSLRSMADAWRPWRSVAARILWHDYLRRRAKKNARRESMVPKRADS